MAGFRSRLTLTASALVVALGGAFGGAPAMAASLSTTDDPVGRVILVCADSPAPCAEAKQLIALAVRHDDAEVRRRAVVALGQLSPPGSLAALIVALRSDEDRRVRLAAASALQASPDARRAREALREAAANDPDPTVRRAAAGHVHPGEPARMRDPDPDVGRIIYTNTAFGNPRGTYSTKSYWLGHWTFRYSLSDEWELGGQATVPVMIAQFGPSVRWTHSFTDYVHLGVSATANLLFGFAEASGLFVAQYGGGPVLTIGSPDLNASVSLSGYGLHVDHGGDVDEMWVFLPGLTFSARVSSMIKLLVEAHLPVVGTDSGAFDWAGEVAVLLYGLRLHGERFYGDISFVIPIYEDTWEFLKYSPVGYPLLNFGFTL